MIDTIELWKNGLKGRVIYNEIEESYILRLASIDFGLNDSLWDNYERKKVLIKIEIIE